MGVALCVGLLQRQLAAIYARPKAVAAAPAAPAAPGKPSARREDARLFDRALVIGLLRPTEDGRIAVAPADLPLRQTYARTAPELLVPRADEPDWLDGVWNDEARRVHRVLHFGAAGRYVRQQVEAFNAGRWTRIRRVGEKFSWWDEPTEPGADSSGSPDAEAPPRDAPNGALPAESARLIARFDADAGMGAKAGGDRPAGDSDMVMALRAAHVGEREA